LQTSKKVIPIMNKDFPLVSIVIPTFNISKYIKETLDSALAQTYGNVEIVVVDDGSTDDTPSIVKKYGDQVRFFRREENKGIPTTLNEGIQYSRGEYVLFFDADDVFMPTTIERAVHCFQNHPEVDFVYFKFLIFYDQDGLEKSHEFVIDYPKMLDRSNFPRFVKGNLLKFSQVMMRRKVFEEGAAIDQSVWYGGDWDLWLQFLSKGYCGLLCDESLFYCRVHGGGLSGSMKGKFYGRKEALVTMERWAELLTAEQRRQMGYGAYVETFRLKLALIGLAIDDPARFAGMAVKNFTSWPKKVIFIGIRVLGFAPPAIFRAMWASYYRMRLREKMG